MKRFLLILVLGLTLPISSLSQSFTQSWGAGPGAIPDGGAPTLTCFPITVTGVGNIDGTYGVTSVCIWITHPWDADLDIFLQAPDGTMVELSTDNGGSGDNYNGTCFSMSAGTSITAGVAPFAGSYIPEGNLSSVNNGQNANGTWSLCVADDVGVDAGFLNSWQINFGPNPPMVGPGPGEYVQNQGGTINACAGTFFDSGYTMNYNPNETTVITFCSNSPGDEISIDFDAGAFGIAFGDVLSIYDGTTATGTPLFSGNTSPGIVTSTTGCLTIEFQSDGTNQSIGWEASISCPSCTDGIQNGNETGIDCGGPDCVACPNCFNGIQDGNETGIDCGPSCPQPCHCSDGILNGDETDVDCGGSCFPCPVPCNVDASYTIAPVVGGCCDYVFNMYDSFGDGWNGGQADVLVNGVSQGPFTLSTGSFGFAVINVCHGDNIQINYTTVGSWASEVSYDLTDPDGNVLYTGTGTTVQTNAFSTSASCTTPGVLDCNGGEITLNATGQGTQSYIFINDFDAGGAGTGWNTSITADYSNPCDPSIDGGTYMWMGNSAPHPRIIETLPLDVSCGGEMCFFLDFATQGNASPCEGIDLPDEGVYLEYSVDGGTTWTVIEYYGPNGVGDSTNSGGTNPQMTSWNQYCVDIPPGAWSPSTMFHWAQTGSSGLNNDHWGLDNVTITAVDNCTPYYYDWSYLPGAPDDSTQTEIITSTTTFTVTYTNGIDACQDTVTVVVPPGTTADAGPDVTMCLGTGPVTIGNDPVTPDETATYTWDNGAGSGTIDLSGGGQDHGLGSANPAVTTDYILTVEYNGCFAYDTMTVIVDMPPTASNPLPINVECLADVPAPDPLVVTDEADDITIPPTVTHLSDVSDGNTCPETITRTYRVTDVCGNFVDVFQTITVDDITPPTGTAPGPVTVECIADVPAADPLLITDEADNCGVPTVTHLSDVSNGLTCPETITRTYRITDACGNFIDVTQTITVDDITPPTGTAPADILVMCVGDVPAADPLL
ncbi:MAG: proprotein convertase P-domain-containing protein, partial [Crocinitomicaceae bacterium]|nr:proprotein convertase P-domain-containing protein [Crocinitomicaceae bacterium]